MSKLRLSNKLHQNTEYPAILSFLGKIGFSSALHKPTGKGHPFLRIALPCGAQMDHFINCTPRGSGNAKAAISKLRRALREVGYDIGL